MVFFSKTQILTKTGIRGQSFCVLIWNTRSVPIAPLHETRKGVPILLFSSLQVLDLVTGFEHARQLYSCMYMCTKFSTVLPTTYVYTAVVQSTCTSYYSCKFSTRVLSTAVASTRYCSTAVPQSCVHSSTSSTTGNSSNGHCMVPVVLYCRSG